MQARAQFLAERAVLEEFLDAVLARDDVGKRAQRVQDPVLELARAHGRLRAVEQPQECAAAVAFAHGADEFEAAAGGAVEDDAVGVADAREPADVAEGDFLRFLQVLEGGAGGADGRAHARAAEAFEGVDLEVVEQELLGGGAPEGPVGACGDHGARFAAQALDEGVLGLRVAFGDERLRGVQAGQLVAEFGGVDVLDVELAGAEVDPREAGLAVGGEERGEVVVVAAFEERVLGDGAGSHDAGDVAVDEALGFAGVLDLVADGDLVAGLDEALDVGVDGVVRHAGHGDGLVAFAAGGEGEAEDARGGLGVVVEHLVEVPHAEEQDHARVLGFDLQVLAHHGGVLRHGRSDELNGSDPQIQRQQTAIRRFRRWRRFNERRRQRQVEAAEYADGRRDGHGCRFNGYGNGNEKRTASSTATASPGSQVDTDGGKGAGLCAELARLAGEYSKAPERVQSGGTFKRRN